ncbi:E3 ubiquitin-protein ligase XIAP-like isoform X3 [Biomphalaria glabrata]|uniref:E3 ubiquitin-protein ligase XIAP-like isoform X3 n=1 Tax=Biomphalaria glabrata TaxID=6526 RepID=A0A9W3A6Q5_BIOGL|nr:E3 ubiquitin-protein ligase XIAP-like isoform X3 [Biomphalaria glabrata]
MENSIERLTGSVVAIQSSHHGQPDECVPSGFKYLEGGVVGVSKEILSSVAVNSLPLSSVPVASGPVSRETISLGKRVTSCDLPVAESVGSSAVVEALSVGSGISVGSDRHITDSQTNIPQNENYSDGACGGLTNNFRLSERKDIGSANIETVTSNASALTIIDNARPKRTEMASKIKRLKSFTSKNNIYQRKEDLSLAGFYYIGYGDCVRCFNCGGGLHDWKEDDDVWVEHSKWFPECTYVIEQMGELFVQTVQQLKALQEKVTFTDVDIVLEGKSINSGNMFLLGIS